MDERRVGDRYRLLEAHAIGGMASVWRALDERTGETVAVKRLHPYLVADAVARERLEREAGALQALHHPNVVEVRDLVLDADGPALVMGFVPGRTAAEALAAGPFPERQALAIAASVGDALAAAHAAGIVHRDVTPSNVLLGDDGRVRLADFGIAAHEDALEALTQADGVIGTLRYLPPERLAGHAATPASDVWSLGAVLVELVAGHPAIDAPDPAARLASPTATLERPAGMSDAAWAVAGRAMDPDPLVRYASGAAIAAELHALAGTEPDRASADAVDPWGATRAVPLAASAAPAASAGPAAPAVSAAPASPRPGFAAVLGGLALAAVIGLGIIGADRVARSGDGGGPVATPAALDVAPAPSPRLTATPRATQAQQPAADHGKHGEDNGKGKGKGHDD